jgi:uncharacterized protein YjdB
MASIGQELLNVPFGDMVESLGMAIAEAQHALDMNSVMMAQIMSGSSYIDTDDEGKEVLRPGVKVNFGGRSLSLLELGFTPTFYQFVDTIIEVKISISMHSEDSRSTKTSSTDVSASAKVGWGRAKTKVNTSSVSASYASKNSYSAEGASLIRTKLVPIPPPAILEQRIKKLMEERAAAELRMDPDTLELPVGQAKTLAVKDNAGAAVTTGLTWASSKTDIATVSTSGEVKAVAAGIATISVKTATGSGELKVSVKAT